MISLGQKGHCRNSALAALKEFKLHLEDEEVVGKTEESTQISRNSFSSEDGDLIVGVMERIQLEREIRDCCKDESRRVARSSVLAKFFADAGKVTDSKNSKIKNMKKKIKVKGKGKL